MTTSGVAAIAQPLGSRSPTRAIDTTVESFVARWADTGGAERANYVLFLAELCDVLGVERPEPARDGGRTDYRFEYSVTFRQPDGSTSTGRIDLYKRGCFVLEARQGTDRQLQDEVQEKMAVVPAAPAIPGVGAWPKRLPDQVQALKRLLDTAGAPIDVKIAAKNFKGAKRDRVEELLRTLVALGQARALPGQRFGR